MKFELESVLALDSGNNDYYEKCQKVINTFFQYQFNIHKPHNFDPKGDSILKELDLGFENVCTSLQEVGVVNPKALTLFEWNAKIQYFEEKLKNKKNFRNE